MKFTITQIFSTLLISLFILAGCQANTPEIVSTGSQVNQPDAPVDNGEMSIEGHLVPRVFATPSFAASGEVVEVLAQEGELVSEGQVIARLRGRERAEATLKTAELELLSAKQAFQNLYDTQAAVKNQAFF